MMQRIHRSVFLPVLSSALAGVLLCSAVSGLPSIVSKSPFLPPDFIPPGNRAQKKAVKEAPGQYQYHGVYQLDGIYYFNIFNTQGRKGSWITEDNPKEDLPNIVSYDMDENLLIVDIAGKEVSLKLIETSDKVLPVLTASQGAAVAKAQDPTAAAKVIAQTGRNRISTGTTKDGQPVRRRVIRPASRQRQTSGAAPNTSGTTNR